MKHILLAFIVIASLPAVVYAGNQQPTKGSQGCKGCSGCTKGGCCGR